MRQLPSEERAVEELQGMLMHLNHHLQLSSSPSAFHSFLPKLIARGFIRAGQEDRATELSLELANVGIGSKETRLVEVLTDVSQRRVGAILFTHWHETFDRLIGGALDLEGKVSGLKVYPAHYGSKELREANVNRFLKHDDAESFPLLIATDMLSEGVDLQDTADCVIHYDLPWNPQKVEQRIGRGSGRRILSAGPGHADCRLGDSPRRFLRHRRIQAELRPYRLSRAHLLLAVRRYGGTLHSGRARHAACGCRPLWRLG